MTYEAYDKLNKDALMKEKLEAHQKYLWDRSAREEDARKEGIEQGIEQGILQGLEQGLNQGIEQGLEQGIEQTKLLIAKSLLETGIQDELIIKNCNITLEQLNELR